MDTRGSIFIWRIMCVLSVIVVPVCLVAGPPGWLMLVLWISLMSTVIPDEGRRKRWFRAKVGPDGLTEFQRGEKRARLDYIERQRRLR
jgi:hypothetical protein